MYLFFLFHYMHECLVGIFGDFDQACSVKMSNIILIKIKFEKYD